MPWWNPTNEPQWAAKFQIRLQREIQRMPRVKIAPRNTSPENSTPCIGYWQSQGEDADHRMMSTTEDEDGL